MNHAIKAFIEEKGPELVRKNLYRNFVVHCCNLFEFGVIGPAFVHLAISRMQRHLVDHNLPASNQWHSNRLAWMIENKMNPALNARKDFSGLFKSDLKNEEDSPIIMEDPPSSPDVLIISEDLKEEDGEEEEEDDVDDDNDDEEEDEEEACKDWKLPWIHSTEVDIPTALLPSCFSSWEESRQLTLSFLFGPSSWGFWTLPIFFWLFFTRFQTSPRGKRLPKKNNEFSCYSPWKPITATCQKRTRLTSG